MNKELMRYELKKLELELEHWVELLGKVVESEDKEIMNMYLASIFSSMADVQQKIAKLIRDLND